MEAAQLGLFMMSALAFVALLEHPASPVHRGLPDPFVRRACMGLAMGLTAVALIYSGWGRRSGAHINPAVTLTFWRLGRVRGRDAASYAAAQFAGAVGGVLLASFALRSILAAPTVRYAVTVPGPAGLTSAFLAEVAIAFVMMSVVLHSVARPRLAPYTGFFAGALVALYITWEAPLSGMSLNPARSLASAVGAGEWTGLWIYFLAPPVGMLAAAEAFQQSQDRGRGCAKLHHPSDRRCIFCGHLPLVVPRESLSRRGRA